MSLSHFSVALIFNSLFLPLLTAAPSPDSSDGTVTATVVESTTLINTQNLKFGTILLEGSSGTIVLSSSGTLSSTSGAAIGGTPQQGIFSLTGTLGQTISIEVVGGHSISCSADVSANLLLAPPPNNLTVSPFNINVGATLNIPADTTGYIECPFTLQAIYP